MTITWGQGIYWEREMRTHWKTALTLSILILSAQMLGCAQPGTMNADGSIVACRGYTMRPKECGAAIYNASRINLVSAGQTPQEVREVMKRDPEARELRRDGQKTIELWSYLTDYHTYTETLLEFEDGKLSSIKRQRRKGR